MLRKSCDGFALIMLLMLAPVVGTLVALVFRLVMIVEFKSEFRFTCINESLAIQKQLAQTRTNGLIPANELLQKLQQINTPIKYYVTLSEYPDYESASLQNRLMTLAYQLKYSVLPGDQAGHFTCGIRLRKAEQAWHFESIYTTNGDRF